MSDRPGPEGTPTTALAQDLGRSDDPRDTSTDPADVPIRLRHVHLLPAPTRVRDIGELTVGRGEVVAVAGPAGSGKTVLVDLLLGWRHPHRGTIQVFGRPPAAAGAAGLVSGLSRLTARQLRSTVGRVVPELVAGFGRDVDVLAAAGIEGGTGRTMGSLSVGERLRIRLAAALVRSAPLLVLDDPTADLDGTDLREFGRMARAHAGQGRTVAITCRRFTDAAACADRLVVLEEGRVVADTGRRVDRQLIRSLRRITAQVAGASTDDLTALPAVRSAEVVDDRVSVVSADGDATLRALLVRYPQAHAVSVVDPTLPDFLTAVTGRAGAP